MESTIQSLLSLFTFKDAIDILLVSLVAYYAFRLLRKSGAVNLFWGIAIFVTVWFLTGYVFHLQLTSALFNQIVSVGAIAIIVIFQNEIRAFFYSVGSHVGQTLPFGKIRQQQDSKHTIEEMHTALLHLSKTQTGALIVITGKQDLDEYAHTGEQLDAALSARLLENIFFKNTPLHDGAVFVSHGRIRSAACILPVSSSVNLPQHFGLRHRAAVGIAEKTDATVLVVSEESGSIAIAERDTIRVISQSDLYATLEDLLG